MKTVKSSLLLLAILFSLGTFAQAQDLEVPCTQQNIRGDWLNLNNDPRVERIIWVIAPIQNSENTGHIACYTNVSNRCIGLYPDGIPLAYTLEDSGQMTILWLATTGFSEIPYSCVRIANTLIIENPDSRFELFQPFGDNGVTNVPTLSEWGLIAMAGVLGIVGFMVIRRKRAAI